MQSVAGAWIRHRIVQEAACGRDVDPVAIDEGLSAVLAWRLAQDAQDAGCGMCL